MFYKIEDYNLIKDRRKKHIILTSVVCSILLILCIVMVILCNVFSNSVQDYIQRKYVTFEVLCIVFSVLMFGFALFMIDEYILNESKLLKHYTIMMNSKSVQYTGEVTGFKNNTTVEKRMTVNIVEVKIELVTYYFYLLTSFDNPFNVGDKVELSASNRYITSYSIIGGSNND